MLVWPERVPFPFCPAWVLGQGYGMGKRVRLCQVKLQTCLATSWTGHNSVTPGQAFKATGAFSRLCDCIEKVYIALLDESLDHACLESRIFNQRVNVVKVCGQIEPKRPRAYHAKWHMCGQMQKHLLAFRKVTSYFF